MNFRIAGLATLRRTPAAGFSLIEIMLAVAIIAFALTGILGLFPVAVGAASESQHETQAALIARSIFEQLQASPGSADRYFTLDVEKPGSPPTDPAKLKQTKISLNTPTTKTYSSENASDNLPALNSNCEPVPSADPLAVYKLEITVAPLPPPTTSSARSPSR